MVFVHNKFAKAVYLFKRFQYFKFFSVKYLGIALVDCLFLHSFEYTQVTSQQLGILLGSTLNFRETKWIPKFFNCKLNGIRMLKLSGYSMSQKANA